ncbi:reverse transcriptase domain-containing protein [Tanacetum coccineum]
MATKSWLALFGFAVKNEVAVQNEFVVKKESLLYLELKELVYQNQEVQQLLLGNLATEFVGQTTTHVIGWDQGLLGMCAGVNCKSKIRLGRHDERTVLVAEVDMMKEQFSKLLLGEDMSRGGKGALECPTNSDPYADMSRVFSQDASDVDQSSPLMEETLPNDQLDLFLLEPIKGYQPSLNEVGSINMWDEEEEKGNDEQCKLQSNQDDHITPYLWSEKSSWEFCHNKNPTLFVESIVAEEKPIPKLKELPSHLEYAFLEGEAKFPIIISSLLSNEEINHFCRLNPNVRDVVKDEIVKILDVRLVYAISDSPWISPVHVVTKKGGMIVVTNEKKN